MPVGTIRALSLRAIVSAMCSMDGINMPSPKAVSISGYKYIPLAKRTISPFAVSRSRLLPTALTSPYDVKSEGKKILPLPLSLIAAKICLLYLPSHYVCRKNINYLRLIQGLAKI